MWPPTPTPLPPATPRFEMAQYSLWQSTDAAITSWQLMGDVGTVIQVIVLMALVLIGMYVVYRSFRQMTEWDSQQ
jgi:hypothetical protein